MVCRPVNAPCSDNGMKKPHRLEKNPARIARLFLMGDAECEATVQILFSDHAAQL